MILMLGHVMSSQLDDADFYRLAPLPPAPPSHPTREETSAVHRNLELNEQAGQRDGEKLRHGEDDILEGHAGDEFGSVSSGSSPSHRCNRDEYQSADNLKHNQHNEGHRLGASELGAQSSGDVRSSSHYCDRDYWSSPCRGNERPPHDPPGAGISEYQYNANPQQYTQQELSHSSHHHHYYGYGHSNYGYYTPAGYPCPHYAQADTYNHYNNPHYHPSHQPYYQTYYQHPHSYYHPPPYPHSGEQWHSHEQAHEQGTQHYYQTSPAGRTSEEEAEDKQSR